MDKSSEHNPLPPKPETATWDLASARSITLIIHGVGNATDETLLTAANEGYAESGLGVISERLTLSECPTLSGKKGAESLVLKGSDGPHFLVTLPWANRRTRQSTLTINSAKAMLILIALATAIFVFQYPLKLLADWLSSQSWFHKIIAWLVLTAFIYLVRPRTTEREFKPPSMLILLLPVILLLGLEYFVEGTWLWIPFALLVVTLWLMSTVIVLRCLLKARTLGWRLALATLIIALAMPGSALIRVAWQYAVHSSGAQRAESVEGSIPGAPPAPNRPKQGNANTGASPPTREHFLQKDKPGAQPGVSPYKSDGIKLFGDGMKQGKTPPAQLMLRPSRFNDAVTADGFGKKLKVAALFCVGICLIVLPFSWLLDFGYDVLNYVGHKELRTSLIDGTAKTILWFHNRAPNTPIIVVGHSLGSVIASEAIGSLPTHEPCLRKIVLVTLGSPLNYLNRAFPESVHGARGLSQTICGNVRWINLWRRGDIVGKALNIEVASMLQYCVGKGGHPNYWKDGAVWKAVAREALGMSDGTERQTRNTQDACLLERYLGLLVFAAITVIALYGAGLWVIARQKHVQ